MADQSLASGAAGSALLHIERAMSGIQDWQSAHAQIRQAASGPIVASEQAGLYYGAPAIAFVLHAASADGHPRYRSTAATLDEHVLRLARRRLATATERMSRGEPTTFREYDLFSGLTGIAALLLRHMPDAEVLQPILRYLVRLTHPTPQGVPGWWVGHHPASTSPTPGGHANFGVAHGITGVLTLLAIALREGMIVDGHVDAIQRVCGWLDQWQQDCETGPWWPQWITRADLTSGRARQPRPLRPSWCYGTVGIARAQQLAGIALGDASRQQFAEHVLAACLADPIQLAHLTEPGLCHGIAGVYQTAWRASKDALTSDIAARLPYLGAMLHRHAVAAPQSDGSLLTGTAGLALAMHTAAHATPPYSGWDTCLLIN